jgi:hypothetical protein
MGNHAAQPFYRSDWFDTFDGYVGRWPTLW